MKGVLIRPSTFDDADDLAPRLRCEDVAEVICAGGSPRESLREGVMSDGICNTVEIDGIPEMMFGVTPAPQDGLGIIWFLSSEAVTSRPKDFHRSAKRILSIFDQLGFTSLGNMVHARNTSHVRWLKKVGFTFTGHTYQRFGEPFIIFERATTHV